MKQITIYDLLPLMKPGFVAMNKSGYWWWFEKEPKPDGDNKCWTLKDVPISDFSVLNAFNIAEFDSDWKDSLMECGK